MIKLHEAIAEVLRASPHFTMTSSEIADEVNRRALYVRPSDGQPVEAKQIAARVRRPTYRDMFEVNGSEIGLR